MKPIITFVQFQDSLFPMTRKDKDLLREHGVIAARVYTSTLDVMSRTLLRNCKIEVQEWQKVEPQLFGFFLKQVADAIPGSRTRSERDYHLVFLPNASLTEDLDPNSHVDPDEPVNPAPTYSTLKSQLDTMIVALRTYLGQYCHSLVVDSQARADLGGVVFRLSARWVEDMPNSIYYGMDAQTPTASFITFGSMFRIRFERRVVANKPAVSIVQEDLLNGVWVPAMQRTFPIMAVNRGDLARTINFLLSLE